MKFGSKSDLDRILILPFFTFVHTLTAQEEQRFNVPFVACDFTQAETCDRTAATLWPMIELSTHSHHETDGASPPPRCSSGGVTDSVFIACTSKVVTLVVSVELQHASMKVLSEKSVRYFSVILSYFLLKTTFLVTKASMDFFCNL